MCWEWSPSFVCSGNSEEISVGLTWLGLLSLHEQMETNDTHEREQESRQGGLSKDHSWEEAKTMLQNQWLQQVSVWLS